MTFRRRNVEEVEGDVEGEVEGELDGGLDEDDEDDVGNFSSHHITWDQCGEESDSDDDWNEDNQAF